MISAEELRRRFPIFERKLFLNSCSKGALSRDVESAYREYLRSWNDGGSRWDDWVGMLEKTRVAFATSVGASPDEIAISYSASTAMAGVLSALDFEGERNRIAIGDFEFPTVAHNLLVQQRRGAEIVRVRASGGRLPVEAYEKALDERVRLVPVTHVCFRNGYRQDLASVVKAARSVGAYSFVDDYQSSGTVPMNVAALGCDFLVTGALKYLLGSSGLGFLYVRKELIEELEPLLTGWFAQSNPFDFDIERATYHHSARRFETGTPPVPNLYAGLAGLRLLEELDSRAVSTHVTALASKLIGAARDRGWEVLTPEEADRRGPLVVLGSVDANRLVKALEERNIIVSARGSGLRVSFHYYNVSEDVDALLNVLDGLNEEAGLMAHDERR